MKAVAALHLSQETGTAHDQPASRFQKPKQVNQTVGQTRQAHAPRRQPRNAYHHNINIQTQQTSSDKIVTWRATINAFAATCTMHTCLRPHVCFFNSIPTPTLLLPTSTRSVFTHAVSLAGTLRSPCRPALGASRDRSHCCWLLVEERSEQRPYFATSRK